MSGIPYSLIGRNSSETQLLIEYGDIIRHIFETADYNSLADKSIEIERVYRIPNDKSNSMLEMHGRNFAIETIKHFLCQRGIDVTGITINKPYGMIIVNFFIK